MVNKGELIVAWDPDLRDMYGCEVVRGDEENKRNILCRVLYMIQYPIQHAVIDGSVANENPPLAYGQVARLKYVRREVYTGGIMPYGPSVEKCLRAYRDKRAMMYGILKDVPEKCRRAKCPAPEEFDILARHARGEYMGRRATIAV